MYVFRDGSRNVPGQKLVSALAMALLRLSSSNASTQDELAVSALVAAGELESGLADVRSPCAAASARLTDAVAEWIVRPSGTGVAELLRSVEKIRPPSELAIAVHEGFAYYALHPCKFVRLTESLQTGARAAVIGLRSIGAPLSAVVSATLRLQGIAAPRITVRPEGHPYDRRLPATAEFREFVDANRGACFLVVDEGPGLSGSSFLCVAEALEAAGVPRSSIMLLGSREPDPTQLRAPRASERWPCFRFLCAESAPVMPEGAVIPIGGGEWRKFFPLAGEVPACWPQLEMAKFLSADRSEFHKFEGFGHFGEEIAARGRALAERGVGAPHCASRQGFGCYQVLKGKLMRACDVSEEMLRAAAEYCNLRAEMFAAPNADTAAVVEMMRWNLKCEFDRDLTPQPPLAVERPAITDGRMLPHKWMQATNGAEPRFIKLDAASHGDDHFLPGPCDIAWDLAGFIVEWELGREASEFFLTDYREKSGDRIEARLRPYMLAYTAFRLGWSRMAAQACAGQPDEALLERDSLRYRRQAEGRMDIPIMRSEDHPSDPAAA